MRWLWVLMMVLVSCLTASWSEASCSGSGTVWSCTGANDTTISNVNAAIVSSSDGATITLASGTYPWTTGSLLYNPLKSTTVICAAVQVCTATVGTGAILYHDSVSGATSQATQKTWRLSGIRFQGASGCSIGRCIWIYPAGAQPIQYLTLRIDNNYFSNLADATDFALFGEGSSVRPMVFQGSIDHNVFENNVQTRMDVEGPWTIASNATPFTSSMLGQNGCLFIESNIVLFSAPSNVGSGFVDAKSGACIVVRFNSFTNVITRQHGTTHAWGTVNFEVYGNAYTRTSSTADGYGPCTRSIHMQGSGTGAFWGNTFLCVGTISTAAINILHYRDGTPADAGYSIAGQCDGTDPNDGNTSLTTTNRGYPCKNQPGRAIAGGSPGWGTLSPIPIFKNVNLADSTKVDGLYSCGWIAPQYCAEHMQLDRDYYNAVSASAQVSSSSPFNGTTGIGHGILANRPTTCTHTIPPADNGGGVMYWATDQGSWNSTASNSTGAQQNGADGVLYRCSATNTWSTYYTPAPFPNIYQGGGGDITSPSAPTNLRVASLSYNSIVLAWDASTDDTAVTGYFVEHVSGGACSGFAQIGSPSVASFTDAGILTNTTYCFRVRATDLAGNLSAYSSTLTATTDSVKFHPTLNMRRVSNEDHEGGRP